MSETGPSSTAQPPDKPRSGRFAWRRIPLALLIWGVRGLALVWAVLAIEFSNLPWPWMRSLTVCVFLVIELVLLWRVRSPWRRRAAFWGVWGAVLLWWMLLIPPSNERHWQPDVAVLPWAQVQDNLVTVHNIRNCRYRSELDYDVRYYDATFDLRRLQSVDLLLVHWGSPYIAHTMISFGFDADRYLCFSIETRKQVGQSYSALRGFFKQYELTYVAADERDLVALRTNHRGEQVYLYRLKCHPDLMRDVFLDYLRAVNSLHDRPEWYNALTSNCTTNIRDHTQRYAHGSWDWRMLVNGHLHELIYERGLVDQGLPQPELKERSLINDRAQAAGDMADASDSAEFSRRIRAGLPGIPAVSP